MTQDFAKLGIVGEEPLRLAGYLVATSRKMDDPLSLLVLSRSAAGKSTLAEAVAALTPPEDVVRVTRLTGQALFYQKNQSLRHKLLVVEEESGVTQAAYALRVLQSAKRLAVTTPQGSHEVEGPVAVIVTTTSSDLNDETKSRFMVVSVDESREQTRRVLDAQRRRELGVGASKDEILRRHHALQRCLRAVKVVNPYAPYLTFPDHRLSTRRDHPKYLGLIRAVAFLRQFQRKEEAGVIQVELADIEAAHALADQVLGQSMEDLSPPARKLMEAIHRWKPKGPFTRREVARSLGWPHVQVWTYVPLGRMAGDWIRKYLLAIRPELVRGKPDPGWLFVSKSGRKMDGGSLLETVRKAAALAGLEKKVTPHALRRACATEMIRRNANPWHVKELLGHEDFRSLDVYAKLTILDLKEAHRKFHPREQGEGGLLNLNPDPA